VNNLSDKMQEMLVIDERNFCIESVSKITEENEDQIYRTKIEPTKLKAKLNQLKYLESAGIDTNENMIIMKINRQFLSMSNK